MLVSVKHINSTAIRSLSFYYDDEEMDEFGTLIVEYSNGREYEYADVPMEKFARLMGAESHGKFVNAEIKPNHSVREMVSLF